MMPPPTTVRGLLGHFPHGADPPATDQRASPLPVQFPTYLSLRAISAARSMGGGTRGEAGGCRSLRGGRGGGSGSGGIIRDGGGETRSETGVAKRKAAATKTMAARASGRRNGPKSLVISDGAGGNYCAEGTDQEESAAESAKWSGKDTEELATEEEAETAGGVGGGRGGARHGRTRQGC